MFLDATENWKDGREITIAAEYGNQPIIAIVGGISQLQSYGMGTWNAYM